MATTPSIAAIAAQRVRLVVHAGQRRLELEEDQRQADLGDGLVVADAGRAGRAAGSGRPGSGRRAALGAGRLEVLRLPRRRHGWRARRGRPRWAGRSPRARRAGRAPSRRGSDGPSPVSTLIASATGPCPATQRDVAPQRRLVDRAVGVHRQDGGGDEAVEVQGHGGSESGTSVPCAASILGVALAGLRAGRTAAPALSPR